MRFFEANGTAYMVMEFVEGAALGDWIKTRRRWARRSRGARRAAARRPGGGAQGRLPAPRHQARQHLYARRRQPGAARLRLGAPERGELDRDRDAGLRAVRAVPHARATRARGATSTRSAACSTGWSPATRPLEAAARVREDAMPSALQAGDRNLFRPNSCRDRLGASPPEDERPQSVAEWRAALSAGDIRAAARKNRGSCQGRLQYRLRAGAARRSSRASSPSTLVRSRRWW